MGTSDWLKWGAVKICTLLAILLLIISASFIIFRTIEDSPLYMGREPVNWQTEFEQNVSREFGLDEPLIQQYFNHVIDTLRFDFHFSTGYARDVEIGSFIGDAVATTILTFAAALLISWAVGAAFEAVTSNLHKRVSRRVMRLTASAMFAVPIVALTSAITYIDDRAGNPLLFGPKMTDRTYETDLGTILNEIGASALPLLICVLASFGLISLISISERPPGASEGRLLQRTAEVMRTTKENSWFAKFYFSWVLCCVLVVDWMGGFNGLGTMMWDAVEYLDASLMMATFYLSALILVALNFAYGIFLEPGPRTFDSQLLKGDSATPVAASTSKQVPMPSLSRSLAGIFSDFRKSFAGSIALVVLCAFVAISLLAPYISTVRNPDSVESLEENILEPRWFSPHEPTFERSPGKGFIHPLGTDLFGRDVYSMVLYGSRQPVLMIALVGLISLSLGAVSGILGAQVRLRNRAVGRFLGWIATVVGNAFVAIPLVILIAGFALRQFRDNVDYWVLAVASVTAIYLWAWMYVVQHTMRTKELITAASAGRVPSLRLLAPTILRRTMFVTKFAVVASVALILCLDMIGSYMAFGDSSWGELIRTIWHSHALCCFPTWWVVFPPTLASGALLLSAFVAIDTLERVFACREKEAVETALSRTTTAA